MFKYPCCFVFWAAGASDANRAMPPAMIPLVSIFVLFIVCFPILLGWAGGHGKEGPRRRGFQRRHRQAPEEKADRGRAPGGVARRRALVSSVKVWRFSVGRESRRWNRRDVARLPGRPVGVATAPILPLRRAGRNPVSGRVPQSAFAMESTPYCPVPAAGLTEGRGGLR